MPDSAGQPHQPTTTPAQTPASASVEPQREVEGAADHQQHHAADQDADRREVQEHRPQVARRSGSSPGRRRSSPAPAGSPAASSVISRELASAAQRGGARSGRGSDARRGRSRSSASCRGRSRPALAPHARDRGGMPGGQAQHVLLGRARRPGSSPTSRPSAMTTMRSASASTSGRSEETTSSATPRGGERAQQPVDLGAGADVDAARRLVDDQEPRLHRQPFREQHLLLVAAREVADDLAPGSAWRSGARR